MHKRRRIAKITVVAGVALAASACATQPSEQDSGDGKFPAQDLSVIAAGDPGGGLDLFARMTEQTLKQEDLIDVGMDIENMGGGGGNPARAALLQRPADGHTLVAESNRVFLNPMTGTTEMTVDDFQPIAKMSVEYLVWAVNADSKWNSAKQVLDAVKSDPDAVSFGVGTVPSDDQFNVLRPAQESGVSDASELNVVVFQEGGDLTSNVVGGNVDVASTGYSEVVDQVEAGKLKVLAVSAPKNAQLPDALDDVPTWHELGIDFELDHWRGYFGPADMPEDAVDWWADTLQQATQTPAWKEQIEKYRLSTDFEGPEQFSETIQSQKEQAAQLIEQTGVGG